MTITNLCKIVNKRKKAKFNTYQDMTVKINLNFMASRRVRKLEYGFKDKKI